MADLRSLEHPTLKVPYESLNKRFRAAQKVVEKDGAAVSAVAGIQSKDDKQLNKEQAIQHINRMLEGLDQYQSRVSDAVAAEQSVAKNCIARIEHLKGGCDEEQASYSQWRKTRVERMLVEHFLRSGFYNTAIKLAETQGIADLTNINLFLVAKNVEEALAVKDMSKCLQWCQDNKSKLRKLKSSLEFNVRLQEYLEKVKAGCREDAVAHARKFLAGSADRSQMQVLQQAMGLLAYPYSPCLSKYKELLEENRWTSLIEQFRNENYRLYQLSSQSVFSVALQAGLSGLKTSKCYNVPALEKNADCPVCQMPLNTLASHLPFAHCSQSKLICFISGKCLNENNQPMMLPNGYVYGEEALLKMSMDNEGQIVCPRTKEIFSVTEMEKVYVM